MSETCAIETLQGEVATLEHDLESTQRELKESRYDVAMLQLKVDELSHRLYGRSSEKLAGQLDLLGDAPEVEDVPDDEATHETPPEKRRKARGGRNPLPKDLRRERVVHEVPEEERACACCGETMQPFGEDVTEELEFIPAQHFVREHVRPKYSCKKCQQGVKQAALPPRPIEKGIPGPGLLAQVLVSKYVDHTPLHRQSGIFKRSGVDVARSTLCDWVAVCVEELEPIVAELRRTIVASRIVQADETPIVVLENHNKKNAGRAGCGCIAACGAKPPSTIGQRERATDRGNSWRTSRGLCSATATRATAVFRPGSCMSDAGRMRAENSTRRRTPLPSRPTPRSA